MLMVLTSFMVFQSTPSARRATLAALCTVRDELKISIHALREEGDHWPDAQHRPQRISIHALREEGDKCPTERLSRAISFQSTPSARRATLVRQADALSEKISIHALREEGDTRKAARATSRAEFQSTPSARRATACTTEYLRELNLFQSTPSARRATVVLYPPFLQVVNFNPRPPRGGRRHSKELTSARF